MRGHLGASVLLLLGACQFDGSGLPVVDDPGTLPGPDGGGVSAPADATPVDAALPPPPDALLPACGMDDRYSHARGEHRYRVSDQTRTWTEARDECRDDEGHLVVVDDADENVFVRSITSGDVWIGLSDRAQEGTFVWVTGVPLAYVNWAATEPNNFFNEDCVELTGGGAWNDTGCGDRLTFVCECDPLYLDNVADERDDDD